MTTTAAEESRSVNKPMSRWSRTVAVASDLVIATALLWTLPLLLGGIAALARLLLN
jgi:hypothetical protein